MCNQERMRYSKDLRKRVLSFIEKGGSKTQATKRFEVSRGCIYNWLNKQDALSYIKPGPKKARKIDRQQLAAYIDKYPDLLLKEYAQHFNVTAMGICKACKSLKITRKKRA